MATKIQIVNQDGTTADVSTRGELITGPVEYSTSFVAVLGTDDVGVEFVSPVAGKRVVVTGVVLSADKNVSGTVEAEVEIYESETGLGDNTGSKSLLQVDLLKQERFALTGVQILTNPARWIMAKTTDDNVKCTLLYYYVKD